MNISEFSDNLIELIKENNEQIRKNSGQFNYSVFYSILEYLEVFIKEVSISDKYKINIERFNEILNEILVSFNNKDFILMSDLFEYELIEEIKKIIEC
jgi:hypothetical protein